MRSHKQRWLRPTAVLLTLITVVACSTLRTGAQTGGDPWANLTSRTAWIILGQLDASSGAWATLPGYHIVRSRSIGDSRMPRARDVLTVTHDLRLHILGFKNHGEKRRLEAPVGVPITDADFTGRVLTPGTRVLVEDVRRDSGSGCDTLCTVWARVSPESRR